MKKKRKFNVSLAKSAEKVFRTGRSRMLNDEHQTPVSHQAIFNAYSLGIIDVLKAMLEKNPGAEAIRFKIAQLEKEREEM